MVDRALTLEFHDDEHRSLLRIEGAFSLIDHTRVVVLSPETPGELGPVLTLLEEKVKYATSTAEDRLEIAISDGWLLSVEADARFEAWEFAGPGGMRLVCGPGGIVSVWDAEST